MAWMVATWRSVRGILYNLKSCNKAFKPTLDPLMDLPINNWFFLSLTMSKTSVNSNETGFTSPANLPLRYTLKVFEGTSMTKTT
ncbi:MAG: hypothetical protein BWY72_00859 [Bacteroidetes bacterium ADurb.Bin416]|nr:MAG: hypothetical protein BWY72_00859 [Bacteroidetes bacterium ADurb.Bin416]